MRARRVVGVVAVAGVGLAGLAGCRSDPDVAAYVADKRITTAEVTRVADEYVGALPQEARSEVDRGELRNQVLRMMVVGDAVARYNQAHQVKVTEVPLDQFAQAQKLPRDIALTPLFARFLSGQEALRATLRPVAATEADRQEAFRNTTIQGRPLSVGYDEVKGSFTDASLGEALAMRDALTTALDEADVTVNPRFGTDYRVPFDVESAQSYFTLPMGDESPVRDAPEEAPAAPATGGEAHDH